MRNNQLITYLLKCFNLNIIFAQFISKTHFYGTPYT